MLETDRDGGAKEEAVKAGYLRTNKEFLKQGLGSGTCCVTTYIEEKHMIVSNLGDCRAVLCRGGVAEALTKDHRAGQEDEKERIENMGGYVEFHRGAWRVHGILAVSRSIGDAHLKDWVLAEPDIMAFDLTPDMEFLILASDGLWEEVGNQEAVDIVLRTRLTASKLDPSDNLSKTKNNEYICVNSSSSPKMRRVSLVKSSLDCSTEERCSENKSPPSKLRRVSLSQLKNTTIQSPSEVKERQQVSGNLVTACRELVNVAVTRGSLDDITVMIIDLKYFRE